MLALDNAEQFAHEMVGQFFIEEQTEMDGFKEYLKEGEFDIDREV